jgi:hypothetical protein
MPKENTHLFFAHRLLKDLHDPEIRGLLKDRQQAFLLGAILPDAFFYHPKKDVNTVSQRLHGIDDTPRNIASAFILESIRHQAPADAAFAMGYLSHCTLDRVFHPVIRRLTGDYDDPDPGKKNRARYRHRLLETALDRQVNTCCFMDQMIQVKYLGELHSIRTLAKRTGVLPVRLRKAFSLQRRANGLFRKHWAYLFTRMLERSGKFGLDIVLPLFYAHLATDPCRFPETVAFFDSETGREAAGGFETLMDISSGLAEKVFKAAFCFFKEGTTVTRFRLQSLIPDKF